MTSNNSRARDSSSMRYSDLDAAKTRGTRAVSSAHHLLWLALAAIRSAPQCPVIPIRDHVAGVPKLSRDAAVTRILQQPGPFATDDLPCHFTTKLEVVTLIVDRPALVRLHVDAAI